jgi:formylglycine-generating enzyme required for sulfatase activity
MKNLVLSTLPWQFNRHTFPLLLTFFLSLPVMYGNNIQVTNISLEDQNTTLNTYQVRFDLSWENSWRTSTLESNWDAAWVVLKYRVVPNTIWNHGTLVSTGSVFPVGVMGEFAGSTGLFIQRSADGIGPFLANGIELRWNYGAVADDAIVEICVVAIEMVYIPGGSFVVGDRSPNPDANFQAGNSGASYGITSENAITLGGTSISNLNVLNNNNFPPDDYSSATTQTLPAGFPKGFDAFYIMKYEISQQQYVDFLNKIPPTATVNRYDDSNFGNAGYMISDTSATPNIFTTSTPDRPCNFLNWADQAAYADWIGLRPMTELEYEKACRGPLAAAVDEFSWGNANIANLPYTYVNLGLENERVTNPATGTGNASYVTTNAGINMPRRCGIFAASAINKTREETGGSYYGVMELTGNLWDLVITTGNPEGRQFTGLHGNGVINTSGNSTVGTTWPSVIIPPIADGTGLRGGSAVSNLNRLAVSNRDLSNFDVAGRFSDAGGRLVRTAN